MGGFLGLGGDDGGELHRLRRRVAVLEAQVEALARAAGVDVTRAEPASPVSEGVRRLVAQGKDIAAIKLHRQETGLGLKEAKDDVDEIKRAR